MKRRALIQHLKKHGCELIREGCKHSVFESKSLLRYDRQRTVSLTRLILVSVLRLACVFLLLAMSKPLHDRSNARMLKQARCVRGCICRKPVIKGIGNFHHLYLHGISLLHLESIYLFNLPYFLFQ